MECQGLKFWLKWIESARESPVLVIALMKQNSSWVCQVFHFYFYFASAFGPFQRLFP